MEQERGGFLAERRPMPGSPGRTRTSDRVVNSHLLYRLSYRGMRRRTLRTRLAGVNLEAVPRLRCATQSSTVIGRVGQHDAREGALNGKTGNSIRRLLDMDVADIASLPAMRRHALRLLHFVSRVAGRFVHDHCIQRASALAYASLLAIVPLLALGVSVFASFDAFSAVADRVRDMLLSNLLPTSQDVVRHYISSITSRTTALSIFGIIGLLVTATALLNTVEEAFNHIWRISRTRPLFSKFITFWATLTLAPIFIGASITITSYFAALPILKQVTAQAATLRQMPFLFPWLMSSAALTTMYMVLPNTRVPFRFAAAGGLVAGALFEFSKNAFAFYVTHLAHYEKLYGALGTLPIFLIWLYVAWVVVLAGSEIVFCLQHPEQSHKQQAFFMRPGVRQFFAHLILARAAERLRGGGVLRLDELNRETGVPDNILQEWLDLLCRKGLLRTVSDQGGEGWVPGRDACHLTLADIHDALSGRAMHVPDDWSDTPLGRRLAGLYLRLDRERAEILGKVTLDNLIASAREESA